MAIDCRTEAPGAFRQVITIDAHTMHADIAVAQGGGGTAPGPHDLFDSSLAACKAITAAWYARQKGFALDRVEVHVERDDAKEKEGLYRLRVRTAFHGTLSDEQRRKLHDVASRCPIHRLMSGVKIEIETAPL